MSKTGGSGDCAGTVVAAHGRHYVVELVGGERLECFPRSKRSEVACGDRVDIERVASNQGVIVEILPRSSLIYRSDAYRLKLIAANLTQVVVVVATYPPLSDEILMRCLIAAQAQDLATLIVLNKYDLAAGRASAEAQLGVLESLGQRVLRLSARTDAEPLRAHLLGHTSLLVGQSGMGKSTLINALVPGAASATREVSVSLNSGRHTTTHATLYRLDPRTALIDSPGMQEFGLAHIGRNEVEHAFADIRELAQGCRFRDCQHQREPNCAVRGALAAGRLDARRLALFQTIADSVPG